MWNQKARVGFIASMKRDAALTTLESQTTNQAISLCQLSESDRFAGFSNYTEDGDFKYKGIQVITA